MDDLSKAYLALGLKAGASLDEIKQTYRDLVKVWHPDRFGHDERLRLIAQDKLKEINGAYEFLQANAFEASIAPDQTAPAEPEATTNETASAERAPASHSRMALWVTLGVFTLAVIVTAAIFFPQKGRDKKATPAKPAATASSASGTSTTYALNFYREQGHLAIATTGSLSGTFTIELWALTRKPRLTQTIVSSRGPADYGFNIKFRQGKRFHADIGDGSKWLVKDANATYSYTKDAWYHIAYVVTPTNYAAYVNGELTADGSIYPAGNPVLYDTKHPLLFGMDGQPPDDLDGNIAEIRIWKTARTLEEIRTNRRRELAGNESGLQGYWRFAHDGGRSTPDLSGHGFPGTLMSTASLNKNGPPITGR
jgi:hypothetical protein